ncbi:MULTISPECIES: c-type cytochrome [Hymenobacter]|uniref:Cytochrome c n=1 Tax=Hymenobacter mucosus TaxID=1411120 RepID=A0A238XGC8_9BACT|nr:MULTISPECIES: c-type cytochrome [Hymenobacter]SNR58055.1 cytochrome c [Hymenobacter mucosus]
MKKAFLLLLCGPMLFSCGSDSDSKKTKEEYSLAEETVPPQDSVTNSNISAVARQPQVDTNATKIGTTPVGTPSEAGAKLIAASDCASCHRENEKLIGPAYQDVAKKYPNTAANVNMLAKKIITGGKGNWGEIPMTPHPALSEKDTQEMVRYILALK